MLNSTQTAFRAQGQPGDADAGRQPCDLLSQPIKAPTEVKSFKSAVQTSES